MLILTQTGILELTKEEEIKPELKEYLTTYLGQYNGMLSTYSWMEPNLTQDQKIEWKRTIASLKIICYALEAGFDPYIPPKNWASGQLFQYLGEVPERVRKSIDKAIPIFTTRQILIYDPNPEKFMRPKVTDPIVTGFVNLAQQRIEFLIAQWDLSSDLKFIESGLRPREIQRTQKEVDNLLSNTENFRKSWSKRFSVSVPQENPTYQKAYEGENFRIQLRGYLEGLKRPTSSWQSKMVT